MDDESKKVKERILSELKFKHIPKQLGGIRGTMCYPNNKPNGVQCYHEDIDEIEITFGVYRDVVKNKQMAITLYSLALDEFIK